MAKKKYEELEADIAELQAKLDAGIDPEAKEKIAELEAQLTDAKEMAAAQAAKLTELQSQLEATGSPAQEKSATAAAAVITVEHKDKNYKFSKSRFRILGDANVYSAEEAAANPELLDKVLAIEGQSILIEVVE